MELPREFELYGRQFISQHCETCNDDIPNGKDEGYRTTCPYCGTPFKQTIASSFWSGA